MFNGRYSAQLYEEYKRWLPWITDVFLPIVDSDTGDLRSLPFEGAILDQPYLSFQIIRLIQLNYRIHLKEKMKK